MSVYWKILYCRLWSILWNLQNIAYSLKFDLSTRIWNGHLWPLGRRVGNQATFPIVWNNLKVPESRKCARNKPLFFRCLFGIFIKGSSMRVIVLLIHQLIRRSSDSGLISLPWLQCYVFLSNDGTEGSLYNLISDFCSWPRTNQIQCIFSHFSIVLVHPNFPHCQFSFSIWMRWSVLVRNLHLYLFFNLFLIFFPIFIPVLLVLI